MRNGNNSIWVELIDFDALLLGYNWVEIFVGDQRLRARRGRSRCAAIGALLLIDSSSH